MSEPEAWEPNTLFGNKIRTATDHDSKAANNEIPVAGLPTPTNASSFFTGLYSKTRPARLQGQAPIHVSGRRIAFDPSPYYKANSKKCLVNVTFCKPNTIRVENISIKNDI